MVQSYGWGRELDLELAPSHASSVTCGRYLELTVPLSCKMTVVIANED